MTAASTVRTTGAPRPVTIDEIRADIKAGLFVAERWGRPTIRAIESLYGCSLATAKRRIRELYAAGHLARTRPEDIVTAIKAGELPRCVTIRRIAEHFGDDETTVRYRVDRLLRTGQLVRADYRVRKTTGRAEPKRYQLARRKAG